MRIKFRKLRIIILEHGCLGLRPYLHVLQVLSSRSLSCVVVASLMMVQLLAVPRLHAALAAVRVRRRHVTHARAGLHRVRVACRPGHQAGDEVQLGAAVGVDGGRKGADKVEHCWEGLPGRPRQAEQRCDNGWRVGREQHRDAELSGGRGGPDRRELQHQGLPGGREMASMRAETNLRRCPSTSACFRVRP